MTDIEREIKNTERILQMQKDIMQLAGLFSNLTDSVMKLAKQVESMKSRLVTR